MDEKEALRVGAAVRRRRRTLGLTLAAVAGRSGLSVPFLSQIENERARPSARSLDRVAEALETTTARLRAAADSARAVDVVRAARATAYAGWCAAAISSAPWSSPGNSTSGASSSTATTR